MAASPGDNAKELNSTSVVGGNTEEKKKTRLAGGLFLGGLAVISMASGFGYTLALAKKQDPNYFTKGLMASKALQDSGGVLAVRALGIGTLYAVSGVSLFSFIVWKLMGVHSLDELSVKMKSCTPNPTKSREQVRNDFKTVREVFDYILSEDEKQKNSKSS